MRVLKTTRSPFAEEVIERLAAVYAIEKRIRGKTEELRKAVRQAETKPLMEALHARLLAVREGLSQIAPLTKAINYMLAHWSGLTRFLDDGRIEPDTNIVERPIRSIAVGKKNSLFCGDEGGGRTWAILSTLLQTAGLNGLDPEVWLADVLERAVSLARRPTIVSPSFRPGTGKPRGSGRSSRREPSSVQQARLGRRLGVSRVGAA